MYQRILLWLIGCGLMGTVQAQNALRFDVSLPIDGAVYQQNNSGTGEIYVTGTINSLSFRNGIRGVPTAQLRKLDRLTGTILSGSPINVSLSRVSQSTFFYGTVTVPKGWYQLTVSQAGVASITRKVGVGEVFIIAGQSNAQGFCPDFQSNQAVSTQLLDAVRVSPKVIAVLDGKNPNDTLDRDMPGSYRTITELKSTAEVAVIGPNGQCRWYWASAAAQLSDALDAPVALFNAAYSGTTITNWVTSANADNRTSGGGGTPDGTDKRYAPGSPFYFFANTLQLLTNVYGVRAVLWMQGETDNKAILQTNNLVPNPGGDYTQDWTDRIVVNSAGLPVASNTVPLGNGNKERRNVQTTQNYRDKLAYLITKSREFVYNPDNQKIPWVVAKASLILGQTNSIITDGQTASLLGDAVIQGPNLDNIGANRRYTTGSDEPVHFVNSALDDVATLWADVLKDMCLNSRVTPFTVQRQGTVPQLASISQDGTLAEAPSGYTWRWVRDNGSFDVNAPVGTAQGLRVSGSNPAGYTRSVTNAPSSGTYRAVLQNSNGQFILTPSVRLPYTLVDDTGCNLSINATVSNANPGCGGAISLNAFCDTGDCNGISYAWSGTGFSSNQQNPSLNAPASNGTYTYTVSATRSGCSTSSSVNINVIGCGPTGVVCYEAEGGSGNRTPESNGSASGGQYVGGFGGPGEYMDYAINGVPSAGNYTLSLFYASGETPRIGLKVNGNTVSTVTPGGTAGWTNFRETTTTISLNAGNNTIRVQGDGGQFTLDKLCVNAGGTPPTTTGCDFAVATPSVSNANPGCSGSINLNANCAGNDCGSAGFAWTLNGTNVATGATPGSISAPGSNGGYTYTVSATKSGCTTKTGSVGITVSGCGTTPPTTTGNCYEAEGYPRSAGTEVSSGGNASGGQYVGGFDGASRYVDFAVNMTSAGSYPLTFYYASGESGGHIDYRINGGAVAVKGIDPNGSWNQFQPASAVQVALNAGANTIRVQGGFRFTLDKICVNGGTTTPPTTPPTNANYASSLDEGSCQTVAGWAFNQNTPAQSITVDIYLNGQLAQGGYPATNPRPDVATYYGTGSNNQYGFSWPVPASYRNGGSLTVSVRYGGTSQDINGSPRSAGTCNGSRVAAVVSEPDADTDTGLVISPNPSSGRVSVRFRLVAGERGSLSVQSLTGAVLQSRAVVGTGAAQTDVLDMEREPAGLYLIRVSGSSGKAQTGRVLLMR